MQTKANQAKLLSVALSKTIATMTSTILNNSNSTTKKRNDIVDDKYYRCC